jgi:hypothetical protein
MSREDLVTRAISAVNERDVEAYLGCCTDDVELHTPLADFTGINAGADGIRRFFADIEDAGPDFRLEVERLELVEARVLASLRVHVSGRSSGLQMGGTTANVYDFEGDRIQRVRIFSDRAKALEAIGPRR